MTVYQCSQYIRNTLCTHFFLRFRVHYTIILYVNIINHLDHQPLRCFPLYPCSILISIYSNMTIDLVTHKQFINSINNIKLI